MFVPKKIFAGVYRSLPMLFSSTCTYSTHQNPFSKTWNVISKDIPVLFGLQKKPIIYPEHADIVVIGGGYIGSSVAYWLKTRAGEGLNVVVLEKEPTYKGAQQNMSLGTLTQHFSLPENIYLAQYGAEFLRTANQNLNVDIEYSPIGHLVLSSQKYAEKLEQNVAILKEFGLKSELLTVDDIKKRYPWINTEDIQLGCIGTELEGSFNAYALLSGLIEKSQELGANYVHAEVTGFELTQQRDVLMEGIEPGSFERINRVLYTTPDGEEHGIKFAICIMAAGDMSGEISKLAKIGTGHGLLSIPLPVEQREEKVYVIEGFAKKPALNTPIIMDTSGLWLKTEGIENNFICGHVPLSTINPKDYSEDEYYENVIKPTLLNRVPESPNIKVKRTTTELYDYNKFDETGVLGPHPYHNNVFLATGFGKHGCPHAPGIGRAIAELIIDSHFTSIDLTRLTFDRLITDQPLIEFNVY